MGQGTGGRVEYFFSATITSLLPLPVPSSFSSLLVSPWASTNQYVDISFALRHSVYATYAKLSFHPLSGTSVQGQTCRQNNFTLYSFLGWNNTSKAFLHDLAHLASGRQTLLNKSLPFCCLLKELKHLCMPAPS